MSKKDSFNEFRFRGLNATKHSNQYLTMNRVSNDNNTIVVKVGENHLIKTTYGYALILDRFNVVFLKQWQVSINWYGNEVLLNRDYWQVKQWGEHDLFIEDKTQLSFDSWLNVAREQETNNNEVKWKI